MYEIGFGPQSSLPMPTAFNQYSINAIPELEREAEMKSVSILLSLLFVVITSAVDAQEKPAQENVDLDKLAGQLKAAVKAGKLSKEEAIKKYKLAVGKLKGIAGQAGGTKKQGQPEKNGFVIKLKRLVEAGKLTKEEATDLYRSAVEITSNSENGLNKPGFRNFKKLSLEEQKELSKTLPTVSTAGEKEGPAATGLFGWAAAATHRFMDNSHTGEPREIHGMSFRLDHRDHDTIGRTWDKVTIRIAHGDWSSIKYNASKEFRLIDEAVVTFDREWSFPTLKGFPALEPAEWGGPQNSLNFRFDKPFAYNGKDAIFVEFVFSGGKAEDGRPWKGDLPFGFEYFLDSMPEEGGWRVAERPRGLFRAPRVEAATSYTAGGQSVWTAAAKGLPYIKWAFGK